jgi:hypothetical protein
MNIFSHTRKNMTMEYSVALERFRVGSEHKIDEYIQNMHKRQVSESVSPDGLKYFTFWDTGLYIKSFKKYDKLIGKQMHCGNRQYTFAVIEKSSGNVYRPSSSLDGIINIKTAIPKGNIYDQNNGLENVDHLGPKANYSKNKSKV